MLLAASNNCLNIVQCLLDHGASLAERNDKNDSALILAAENDHLETVQWLLENKMAYSFLTKNDIDRLIKNRDQMIRNRNQKTTIDFVLSHPTKEAFLTFSMGFHSRLGAKSPAHVLPKDLYFIIGNCLFDKVKAKEKTEAAARIPKINTLSID